MAEVGDRVLLDALPDGVILINGEQVAYSNSAASQLLGTVPPAALERITPVSLVELVQRAREGKRAEHTIERGTPPRWIEVVAKPLGADARSVVLVLRDVTEVRKVEAMRRDFVADASHELKTPVATIQAVAETLLRALDEDPPAARRFAEQLHATAGRLSLIVSDMLDLSRVESEESRVKLKPVDLEQLAIKELDRIADRAEVEGVNLRTDLNPVNVLASRKDLRLALRNLLENALEYTGSGDTVTVATRAEGAEGVIAVADSGIGIPRRDVSRIFERFYRVDDARNRDTGGTGLGLAIVRNVVDMHGGTVSVDSELGVGSTFTIRLPLLPED